MELWIRSQNRNSLVKISNIFLEDDTTLETDTQEFGMMTLGTYKTEERALEVLDEIQRLIEDLQYMSYAIPNKEFSGYRPNVYEMPKE